MYKNSISSKDSYISFDKYYAALEVEIDFDFFVAYSLGCSNLIHEKITFQYSLNKEKYYNAYKKSPYYKDIRLTSLSVSNQLATQYLIGIISCMSPEEKKNYFMTLIKTPFKFIYKYIVNNPVVDIYRIRDLSLEYAKNNKLSIIFGSIHVFSITLYLCKILNKKILLENDYFMVKLLKKSFAVANTLQSFDSLEIPNEDINKFKKNYSKFPVKKNTKLSLNHFITELNKTAKLDYIAKNNISIKSNEQFNELAYKNDFVTGVTIISTFLSLSEINIIDLQNITSISHEDIQKILILTFDFAQENENNLNLTNEGLFGIFIILEALVRDYKKTKQLLLDNSIEEYLLELSNLKLQYQSQITNLQSLENHLSITNQDQKNKICSQENEIFKIQKENNNLLNELAILKEQNLKLNNKINEYESINTTLVARTNEISLNYDEVVNFLLSKKILLVSGNTRWHSKLSKLLPNLKYLQPSQLTKELNYVTNFEAIFFDYTFNNHSMFEKIKQALKDSCTPFYYCGEHSNIKMNLIHFYSCLSKQ